MGRQGGSKVISQGIMEIRISLLLMDVHALLDAYPCIILHRQHHPFCMLLVQKQ
jgi:hypothetical protein